MDNRSIFSKTGKGSLEITKKSIKLSSEERQALILVDGKTAYGDLQEKLSRVPPMKLRMVFEKLTELELIREFVAANGPVTVAPAVTAAAAAVRQLDGGSDLDFTALIPAAARPAVGLAPSATAAPDLDFAALASTAPAPTTAPARTRTPVAPPPPAPAKPSIDADEEARKFHEMMFGADESKAAADAARQALEAEAAQKAEAERAAREQAARDQAAREQVAKAQAAKEQAAKEQAAKEQAARQAAEAEAARKAEAERAAREAAEADSRRKAEEEARLKAEEETRRKAEEETRRKAEEEARRKAEEETRRKAEEEARRKAEEEARLKAEEEARRKAEEEARRKAEEEARRKAEEEARRKAEEEARRKAEEEARRKAEEEARRKAEEEARRKAEEEARRKAEEEARRKAEEEARRKAEEEARRKAEEEARRKAEEEARRKAEEEARRKAEEEARRKAEEEARRKAEEEARRKAEEEARLKAEEEARRKAEAEARRKAEEEARRKAEDERHAQEERELEERHREEREKLDRERKARAQRDVEERERSEREAQEQARAGGGETDESKARAQRELEERERSEREAQEQARVAAREAEERKARAQREAEERERSEREAQEQARVAAREADERQARAQREAEERERAEREAQEQARVAAREAEERKARAQREAEERERAEREAQEQARAAATAAAALAASSLAAISMAAPVAAPAPEEQTLDFNAEAKAAFDADLNFAPAPSVADEERRKAEVDELLAATAPSGSIPLTGNGPDTFADTGTEPDTFSGEGTGSGKAQELASRKEIEREAKDRAKAEAKARKEAEREAKRLAKESHVKLRRGGPSLGVMIGGAVVLALVGAVGYLFVMPIDKAAIERTLSERLGEPVKVASAKFSPLPPTLTLGGVAIGSVTIANIVANPDTASLMSDHSIWKTVDVSGIALSAESARSLVALALRDVPKIAASKTEIQRVRISDAEITGLPLAVPKFKVDMLLTGAGALKQVTLISADDKARVVLSPDEKGWVVDIESRGVTWPLGPKVAWENIRAKGSATSNGIKFDDYAFTHFSGTSRGAGELTWNSGWKFNGNLDVGSLESEAIAQALYGAAPVSGTIEGKLSIVMSAPSLPRLFDAPRIDGALNVNKATVKALDLARTAQPGATPAGATRFTDFSATLATSGGKLQLKDIKGVSGLLTVTGTADVNADKSLGGTLTVELGVGGSRAKATPKLAGTVAEPKLEK